LIDDFEFEGKETSREHFGRPVTWSSTRWNSPWISASRSTPTSRTTSRT
jgi:hypothetical protein